MVSTLPVFEGLKRCIQYLDSHPRKPIFIPINVMMSQMLPGLHGVGIKLNNKRPKHF